MRHTVLKTFRDKQTDRIMIPGQSIQTDDEDRIRTLSSQGFIALPDKVPELKEEQRVTAPDEFPKHTGGGYFELSNGEKVQGKEAAVEAQKALNDIDPNKPSNPVVATEGGVPDDNA